MKRTLIVFAEPYRPKVDSIACPSTARYNDLILRKEKTPRLRTTHYSSTRASQLKTWSLYQVISWLRTLKREFFVRSGEQNPCPCCGERLKVIGSRGRKYINGIGEKVALVIRRLKCSHCSKVHHELPGILIPYKRYGSESIEAVVGGENELTVAADESTINRWRQWFREISAYLAGALMSIAIRYCLQSVEGESNLPKSPLQRIWQQVGNAPHWLARTVRPVVNANYWIQTRSALLSG